MSDASVKEEKRQTGLAQSYEYYLIAVICFIVGLAVFIFGGGGDSMLNQSTPQKIIGWLIMGGPIYFGVFMSKSFKALLPSTDYEVVTTYSDGSKTSSRAESSALWLIGVAIGFILGVPLALLRIVWLTIKTIAYYIGVKEKPPLLLSPFPVLLLFFVGTLLALIVPPRILRAQMNAIAIDEPEIVQGSILIVDTEF